MTADPQLRRRASRLGLVGVVVAIVLIAVLGAVAVSALRSSEEGSEVERDERLSQQFPSTPAAIVAVTSGERLSSLVVMVLAPSGQGGSVVTVPVNVDTTSGFGTERLPFARRAFSTDDATALTEELAPVVGIEPSFVTVVDEEALAELIGDIEGVNVSLDEPVLDVGDGAPVTVVEAGDRRLDPDEIVDALTAVAPGDRPAHDHHEGDVEVWRGLAAEWSLTNEPLDLERDEVGTPIEPASFDELVERLRAGRVEVRDLAIDPTAAITLDNPTNADYVIVDFRDVTLVFASIAPERVLTPNPTLTFKIVAPFNRSQLASVDEDFTTATLVRELIGELVFFEANVVSVDTEPAEDGAVAETVVIVDEERFEDTAAVPTLIGPSTSRIAARDTDGSDVTLVLGTDFLAHRAEMRAEREAERSADDGSADFDVSQADADAGSDDEADPDAPSESDDDADADPDSGSDADPSADTVESDE